LSWHFDSAGATDSAGVEVARGEYLAGMSTGNPTTLALRALASRKNLAGIPAGESTSIGACEATRFSAGTADVTSVAAGQPTGITARRNHLAGIPASRDHLTGVCACHCAGIPASEGTGIAAGRDHLAGVSASGDYLAGIGACDAASVAASAYHLTGISARNTEDSSYPRGSGGSRIVILHPELRLQVEIEIVKVDSATRGEILS
jgi:hypothetical protein